MAPATSINWLHLTDLHQGLKDQDWLWPSVKERFFEDLARLHGRAGPWDLVLFTGDLTQRGTAEEFDRLTETLEEIWEHLAKLGSTPALVAVPGNHDLVRPDARGPRGSVVKAIRQWHQDREMRDDFWSRAGNEYRALVEEAFAPYMAWQLAWRRAHPLPAGVVVRRGALPGDEALEVAKEGIRLALVGLNSAFLQFEGGDYEGRLDLDARQINAVCGGDPAAWLRRSQAALLLTHHPVEWLEKEAQEGFKERIAPPGRFVAHLFGHMHEPASTFTRVGGAAVQRRLQGASLFGLETWGDGRMERVHGYSAGRVEVQGTRGVLRVWPRKLATMAAGHRKMVADQAQELDEDEAFEDGFAVRGAVDAGGGTGAASGVGGREAAGAALEAEVERYRKAIAADRGQGLLSWEDLGGGAEAMGERDLLGIFVVPDLVAVPPPRPEVAPGAEGELEAGRAEEPGERGVALPSEPANAVLFDDARPWTLVMGGPGAGKSALSAWLLLTLCVPGGAPPRLTLVPVRVSVRNLEQRRQETAGRPDLFEFLEAELAPDGLRASELRALAEAGRIYWIFDGLDEVVDLEARAWHARQIARIKEDYRGCGSITSRLAGCERAQQILAGHGVRAYRLLDFDNEHIDTWVTQWHAAMARRDPDVAARRRDRLQLALRESSAVEELCRTPLLLTLVAGLSRRGDLPTRRREIYARVVSYLADEWEANKGLGSAEGKRFDYEMKERFLRGLAWSMMEEPKGGSGNVVTEVALERFAVRFCVEDLGQPHAVAARAARHLIAQLRDRNGILVYQGSERYGFAHRALLDYLAAAEVVERVHRGDWRVAELGALLKRRCGEPSWVECLTLAVGEVAERWPEAAVQVLQDLLRRVRMALDESNDASFVRFCVRCLGEVERLDREPLRSFGIRLTELLRACPLYCVEYGKPVGGTPEIVVSLRAAGDQWPGAPILRAWALEARDKEPSANSRRVAYQMALATASEADRMALLLDILSQEAEPEAFGWAVYEAGHRSQWGEREFAAVRELAAKRGERVEWVVGELLAIRGDDASLERILALVRSGADAEARLSAAHFLFRVKAWKSTPVRWRQEIIHELPSLVESCKGIVDRWAVLWLEEALSVDAALEGSVRCLLASPSDDLREWAALVLAKRGDSEAVGILEQRVRQIARRFDTLMAVSYLELAAEASGVAREAISRILLDRKVAHPSTLLDLATWWGEHVHSEDAGKVVASVAKAATDDDTQFKAGMALARIPGGKLKARQLFLKLARGGKTLYVRRQAVHWLGWSLGPLDEGVSRELLKLTESSYPEVRGQAAAALAQRAAPAFRSEGLRVLNELARSDAPEETRLYVARDLHHAGNPVGTEALAELAESASVQWIRLDAAREIQDEAALRALADSGDDAEVRTRAERYLSLLEGRRRLLQVGHLRRGIVSRSGQRVGVIEETSTGTRFTYDAAWLSRPDARPLGPSLPLRHASYESEGLLPFFENLLPEGWLLDITRRKLGVAPNDPFGLLLATCGDCIGAVEISPAPDEDAA